MQLLPIESLESLIRASKREAFHLELQDDYTADGDENFRAWLDGNTEDDYAWLRGWLNLVEDLTVRGGKMRRARVVTTPHTDYTRWLLEVSRQNIAAGEEIRYVPRHVVDARRLTTDDWWLLDDAAVMFTVFDQGGQFAGGALTTDPRIIAQCQEVRDYVWNLAIPFTEYAAASTPQ
ncbi:DUF6879 family protein [Nocardia sp. NPDC127579]|uniref:DUF6879 family protein n=1 Tax=Nocardia sp. NPDC127579 TaxID=3345402 RepID=UPI003640CDA1